MARPDDPYTRVLALLNKARRQKRIKDRAKLAKVATAASDARDESRQPTDQ